MSQEKKGKSFLIIDAITTSEEHIPPQSKNHVDYDLLRRLSDSYYRAYMEKLIFNLRNKGLRLLVFEIETELNNNIEKFLMKTLNELEDEKILLMGNVDKDRLQKVNLEAFGKMNVTQIHLETANRVFNLYTGLIGH